MLSQKKHERAIAVGEACTKSTFKEWNEHGTSFFPKGILILRSHCIALARIHADVATWKVTEEERELAAKAAADLFDLFVGFHERMQKEKP